MFSSTGLLPSMAAHSHDLRLTQHFLTPRRNGSIHPNDPTTPTTQRLPALTRDWFSLIRFRSPLLAESRLFSLPAGNEMFHFPAFPPHALCVQARVTGFRVLPGFPIRKSSDHSSVDSSPRHIAASHVLHRLLVPRHPPCALNNLATKMLASTVQFSRYGRPHPPTHGPPADTGSSLQQTARSATEPPGTHTEGLTRSPRKLTPSGPNSVPQTVQPHDPVPSPPQQGVLETAAAIPSH